MRPGLPLAASSHNLLRPRAAWLASPMQGTRRHLAADLIDGVVHPPATAGGEIILYLPENWHRPQDRIHLFDAAWARRPGGLTSLYPVTALG